MMSTMRMIAPELWLLGMAVFFLIDAACEKNSRRTYNFALASSGGLLLVAYAGLNCHGTLFHGAYRVDLFSQLFKLVLAAGLAFVVFISRDLKDLQDGLGPEYFLFLSCSMVGMMMLTSAVELITLYGSPELTAYSLYVMIPMRKGDSMDTEASIKYLLFGVACSAITLYGLSFIFGFSQTTYLSEIVPMAPQLMKNPAVCVAFVLAIASFLFKLSVFPFHFWAPDVYEGGHGQIVTFIATVSKAATVAVLIRLFSFAGGLSFPVNHLFIWIAMITMSLGNLVAISQKDIKRMLAYSSIAQAGYILVGILAASKDGFSAAIFYATAYVIMNFAAFMTVVIVSKHGENPGVNTFAGLSKRSPLLALTFMLALFSLAGLPSFAGFAGKWFLFKAAMEQGYWMLVLVGVANSTISLYYYLMVIKQAYMMEPVDTTPITLSAPLRALSLCLIILMVFLGFYPTALLDLCRAAVLPIIVN